MAWGCFVGGSQSPARHPRLQRWGHSQESKAPPASLMATSGITSSLLLTLKGSWLGHRGSWFTLQPSPLTIFPCNSVLPQGPQNLVQLQGGAAQPALNHSLPSSRSPLQTPGTGRTCNNIIMKTTLPQAMSCIQMPGPLMSPGLLLELLSGHIRRTDGGGRKSHWSVA